MTVKIIGTTVEVLAKTYQLKCPEQQVESLQKAAHYLDERMQEVREATHVLSNDRVAVLAALNITHKFLALENEHALFSQMTNERLNVLHEQIEESLPQNSSQLELATAQ